MSTRD